MNPNASIRFNAIHVPQTNTKCREKPPQAWNFHPGAILSNEQLQQVLRELYQRTLS
jgi:hypothetical protein